MGSHRAFSCTTYCSPLTVPLPFLNSKLGLPVETASSNSPPKDCVPTSPQVAGQTHTNTHPQRYTVFFGLMFVFCLVCPCRSVSLTLTSLILWLPRKPAFLTSATEGQLHLHPPLTVVRTRASTAPNARPFPPMFPQVLPPISPSHPILLHPLTSNPAQPPTPTLLAPQKAVALKTCLLTRVPPAETLPPAPFLLIGPSRTAIGTLPPDQWAPPALLLAPLSQLPLLSSAALPYPAVQIRSSKRNQRSTKTRIERGRKGNEQKEPALVLPL